MTPYSLERRAKLEWLSTLMLTFFFTVGAPLSLYMERLQEAGKTLEQVRLMMFTVGVFLLIALWVFRKRTSRTLTVSVFFIVFGCLLFTSTVYHLEHSRLGKPWIPFLGQKIILFGLATLLSGPIALNIFWMLVFIIQVFILWFTTDLGNISSFVAGWEPIYTVFFGAMGASLLALRYYYEKMRNKKEELEKLTHIFLSIRDLANTPLQNLKFCSELVERNQPEPSPLVVRMNHAIERLTSLNQIFRYFEEKYPLKTQTPLTKPEILQTLRDLETV